ncbi:MAG: hypothetical protein A3G87_04230 [Omnitrophica bacterium RIFCSPLOWO2_12_FULL_50_11]|nr:MAG: hypothetical protein A3G87_04230 [Omnitrophica bacterium RIFCSPLOWO2_12_FULL_50_11]
MGENTTKVAVSLPTETYKQVERLRRQMKLARSAAVLQALRLWLHQKQERDMEERYAAGYKQKPEHPREVEPFFQAGLSSFSPESW